MKKIFVGIIIGILICCVVRISPLHLFNQGHFDMSAEEVYHPLIGRKLCVDLRPLNRQLKEILDEYEKQYPEHIDWARAYVCVHHGDSPVDEPVYMLIYDTYVWDVWLRKTPDRLWEKMKLDVYAAIEEYFAEVEEENAVNDCPSTECSVPKR